MSGIGPAYRCVQHMSLDVVLGAFVTGLMAASLLEVTLPHAWYIAFPLSVWVFYTGDHLIDAHRLGLKAHTARHQFHVKFFFPLSLLVATSCLLILYAIFLAPAPLIYLGALIGGMGLAHLILSFLLRNVISKWIHKELGVALVYTCGIWGGPIALMEGPIPIAYWGLSFQFFLLAIINLLIFSYQDLESDILDGHTSMVRAYGDTTIYRFVTCLLIGLLSIGIWQMLSAPLSHNWLSACGISMGIGLIFLTIHLHPDWFHTQDRYRFWGDGAFLLSGSYFFMG